MRRHLLIFAAPLALLSACATGPDYGAVDKRVDAGGAESPYGLFLAGEGAMNQGRSAEAANYFDRARALGDQQMVAERAFTAALLAGDVTRAAALAPESSPAAGSDAGDSSEAGVRLGRLVKAVEAMAQGKGRDAQAMLSGDKAGVPYRAAAALLAPWAAAEAGDVENSLTRPEVRGDKLVEYFGQLGQAYLFERAKRYDEAETDFKAITAGEQSGELVVLAYGGFLERRGRRLDAVALYDGFLAQDADSEGVTAAKARAAAGKKPPAAPTVREGAAQALLAPAAVMLGAKQDHLALAFLRLTLRLDPKRDDAAVLVGDILAAAGDVDAARAAYEGPKPGSTEFADARAKLAWSYQNEKDPETALKLARQGAAGGSTQARLTLADLLRVNDQFAESAQLLSGLIAEAKTPDWRLYYARGVAYERMNRWSEAEADLQSALKLRPEEPELLNYLGYSWIDRGERLPEAMGMVEKAVAADPKSGAMVDSLGWAHYRLGDYKKAVETLEQAVELQAGDPEINNHLGDAYWRVGRRDEAQFQWRRVLTLDPDPKIKADAEAKLKNGLGPAGPAKAPKLAGN
jgi:Flp pilus assembly protein TadD